MQPSIGVGLGPQETRLIVRNGAPLNAHNAHCFRRSPLPIRKEKATPAANVPSALGR